MYRNFERLNSSRHTRGPLGRPMSCLLVSNPIPFPSLTSALLVNLPFFFLVQVEGVVCKRIKNKVTDSNVKGLPLTTLERVVE